MHIPSKERSNFDPKSKQCVFLRYGKGVKSYKFWDLTANKVVISRDVVFDENFMLKVLKMKSSSGQKAVAVISR